MKANNKGRWVNLNISEEAHQALKHLCVSESLTQAKMLEKLVKEACEKGIRNVRN